MALLRYKLVANLSYCGSTSSAKQGVASRQVNILKDVHSSLVNSSEVEGLKCSSSAATSRSRCPRVTWKARAVSPEKATFSVGSKADSDDGRVVQIHSRRGLENALARAGDKLVVVEYAGSKSRKSAQIYPAMVELSRNTREAVFLLVIGDESDETVAMCEAANVTTVPHFVFHKNGQVVHEETSVDEDQLVGDVLYYGNTNAPIHQLHGEEDVESLLQEHAGSNTLVVIDVNLKFCGPCAKVYPTVVNLSRQMQGTVVFARMVGDENPSCEAFLRKMEVKEVPTFLFIRDNKLCGEYVGSNRGALVGEVLRHQGVRCT